MCNLYHVSPKGDVATFIARHAARWVVPDYDLRTVGPNQDGVLFRADGAEVVGQVGQWGMIRPGQPERLDYLPSKVPGKRGRPHSTNNTRIEGIDKKVPIHGLSGADSQCRDPKWSARVPGHRCAVEVRSDGTPAEAGQADASKPASRLCSGTPRGQDP